MENSRDGQVHQLHGKDYVDPPPARLLDMEEIRSWSFYRALLAEFVATLLFLYILVATVIGHKKQKGPCDGVGPLGIAWAVGGMIFVLVYCTAGISGNTKKPFCLEPDTWFFSFVLISISRTCSIRKNHKCELVVETGGHINPAVTLGLFVARKVSLVRAVAYMVAQCLGSICGAAIAKSIMRRYYNTLGGGANEVASGYSKGSALGAEIIGTFVLVYTVFSATDPKRNARDSHVPVSISRKATLT